MKVKVNQRVLGVVGGGGTRTRRIQSSSSFLEGALILFSWIREDDAPGGNLSSAMWGQGALREKSTE